MQTALEIATAYAKDGHTADLERMILRHMEHHIVAARAAEREACAKVAEEWWKAADGAAVDLDVDRFPVPERIRSRT